MSMKGILDRLERDGKLVRYLPSSGMEGRRSLYLAAGFFKELGNHRSALQYFDQKRAIAAVFDNWVLGERFVVRLAGKGSDATLALLEPPPPEIWEFRITETRPQARVFARFAETDILVAFLARNRDTLGSALHRSGRKSRSWLEAMHDCEAEWKRIFGGASPFRGSTIRDYISRNTSECP